MSHPENLLFTIVKKTDFIGSLYSNRYKFQHYNISDNSLSLNGKQFPNEGVYLGMDNEKKFFMGYRTLFDASGIDHSNTELQITHDTYINVYFFYPLTSHLIGACRRIIRPIPRTAILESNYNLISRCPKRTRPCFT